MGYFRIFYYIAYIFNTICRVFKRNKKLIIIVLLFVAFFFFYNNKSHAVYNGDYTYSDPNVAVYNAYDSICLDFLRRYEFCLTNSDASNQACLDAIKTEILSGRSVYLYYNTNTSSKSSLSMVNGAPLSHAAMFILIYRPNNYHYTVNYSQYDNYLGIDCQVLSLTRNTDTDIMYYIGVGKTCYSTTVAVDDVFYVPFNLLNYNNQYIYDYFVNNKSLQEIEQLYAINNSLNTITDDTISQDAENEVDDAVQDLPVIFDNNFTSDVKTDENSLLNTILTPIYTYADGTTNRGVTFTLPFVNVSYTIRGNAISSHIRNTAIYTYVQLFWWVAFSVPIFFLLRRIIVWLGTGEFLNKPSAFAVYMSNFVTNNITPGMM